MRRGVVTGCSANPPLYCPQAAATRAQTAVFISGVYEFELYGA